MVRGIGQVNLDRKSLSSIKKLNITDFLLVFYKMVLYTIIAETFTLGFKTLQQQSGGVKMEVLKVSSHSIPNSVAGAIAGVIREQGAVEVQAVGAGAANQALKATAIARGFLAVAGINLICIPAFTSVEIAGEERTAIKLIIEPR